MLNSKEKEIYKNVYNKILDKIEELSKEINYDNLKFFVQSSCQITDFSRIKCHVSSLMILEKINYQWKMQDIN